MDESFYSFYLVLLVDNVRDAQNGPFHRLFILLSIQLLSEPKQLQNEPALFTTRLV
jgi:hypothetical protein